MGKPQLIITTILMLLVILLASCGGIVSSNRDGSPGLPGGKLPPINLPAPSTMRDSAVITSGVFRHGSQFASALASQLVTPSGNSLSFTPSWVNNGGLTGAAYAIYAFDSSGYSTDDSVHLAWQAKGSSNNDLWIGMANFSRDRWDWSTGLAGDALPYDPAHYSASGHVYVVVLCLGNDIWELRSICISPDVPPVVIAVHPLSCTTGLPLAFAATVEGSVDSYSWDFGGGAAPNTSTDSAPTVTAGAPGVYSASVTVSNAYGSDAYSFDLTVSPPPTERGDWWMFGRGPTR